LASKIYRLVDKILQLADKIYRLADKTLQLASKILLLAGKIYLLANAKGEKTTTSLNRDLVNQYECWINRREVAANPKHPAPHINQSHHSSKQKGEPHHAQHQTDLCGRNFRFRQIDNRTLY